MLYCSSVEILRKIAGGHTLYGRENNITRITDDVTSLFGALIPFGNKGKLDEWCSSVMVLLGRIDMVFNKLCKDHPRVGEVKNCKEFNLDRSI